MNKKFLTFYTIFASLVFAFSIFFFSYNLYNEYLYNEDTSGQTYYNFGLKINEAANTSSGNISKTAENIFNKSTDFHSVSVSINNKTICALPDSQTVENSSRFVKTFTTKFETQSGIINIKANIYLLKPDTIGYYARLSFLIVLIITLITIILIIFSNIGESKEDLEIDNDDVDYYSDVNSASSYENSFELMNTQEEIIEQTEKEEIIDTVANNTTEEIKLPYEELKPIELEKTPTGLFNPESGIGWETYLTTRLESELSRAIASEIDLSLFVFQLPQVERNSDTFHNICNYLSIQFQFKDLLFEFESDCLVAIRNSMNLDEALTFSDKLYADIKNMIEDKDCYIGISSRSIRMVSGERLLIEAKESLKYAKEDKSSPIVAFRVDSAKYQEYMERNQ